jgi:hypothetical protein
MLNRRKAVTARSMIVQNSWQSGGLEFFRVAAYNNWQSRAQNNWQSLAAYIIWQSGGL